MLTVNNYTAVKDQVEFTFSFNLSPISSLVVTVDGETKTEDVDYTVSGGIVRFNVPMQGGEQVTLSRDTDVSSRAVDFSNGSYLTEEDLDAALTQVFMAIQELKDRL
jgi:hypothetical protein